MPKQDKKSEKHEDKREKSADKKKGKREEDVSPSPSRDSGATNQKKGKKEKEDDNACFTVRSTPSHMAQCSNEQFLSSCLPLLATLSPKKNFLARINIQKALYDAIDEAQSEAESEEECCVVQSKPKPKPAC